MRTPAQGRSVLIRMASALNYMGQSGSKRCEEKRLTILMPAPDRS
jgi:hypothetical protein